MPGSGGGFIGDWGSCPLLPALSGFLPATGLMKSFVLSKTFCCARAVAALNKGSTVNENSNED
jgi:hypothetical protein